MITIIEDTPKKLSGITSLFISFNFKQQIVDTIKSLDKYHYNNENYTWEVPINNLSYLLDELTYFDDITLTIKSNDDKKEQKTLILKDKYKTKPLEHQLEGILYGLNHDSWLLLDDPGLGKAFTLDTKILTASGYKLIKDIHPGNIVYDKEGNECTVLKEYNHDNLEMYKITFSTGYSITCCKDHLWEIIYDKPEWNATLKKHIHKTLAEVHDTKWLLNKTRLGNCFYKSYHCRIPLCKPVKFKENKHIIHPYVLGFLLGDGSLHNSCSFTTADEFVVNKIKSLLPDNIYVKAISKYNYRLNHIEGKNNIIYQELKRLQLNTTTYYKHIPDEYLYDSVENRLALIQGLLDSDGYALKGNSLQFGTSSKTLCKNIEFLIQSLGGYTKVKSYTPSYFNKKYNKLIVSEHQTYSISISINNPQDLVSLPRKKLRLKERHFKIRNKIINIEYVGNQAGKCLTVDSPSHTYLIDKCIVTHNTLQMIYLAQELKEQSNLKHCLVICGINSLKTNWESEIEKHSDLSYRILGKKVSKKGKVSYKTIKERAKELLEPIDEFFIITNIETLRSDDIVKALKKNVNKIDMVVFDEAHKAKNPSSIQGNHLLKLTNYDHKVALTGTLIMNKPLDAFTALKWLGIEKATYTDFKNQYCEYGGFGGHQVIGYKNLDILKEEIENSSLRRTKDILKDLPEKTVITEMLDMEDDHKKFYSDIIDGVVAECDKVKLNPNNVLALTTRLRQAASCPSVLTSNKITATKIERALDLIEEIVCSGHKVVVMSTFKEPIRELYPLTKQYNALLGTGDQTDDELARNIKLFQTDDKYKVFLATTQKCGTGQTLNKASYMICIDCPWNYALQLQVEDRIHRIGSKEPVFIYRLVCKDTIDEKVNEYISVKKAVGDYLIDDIQDEATISKLRDYILDLKK